jgi:hypothetical protein
MPLNLGLEPTRHAVIRIATVDRTPDRENRRRFAWQCAAVGVRRNDGPPMLNRGSWRDDIAHVGARRMSAKIIE